MNCVDVVVLLTGLVVLDAREQEEPKALFLEVPGHKAMVSYRVRNNDAELVADQTFIDSEGEPVGLVELEEATVSLDFISPRGRSHRPVHLVRAPEEYSRTRPANPTDKLAEAAYLDWVLPLERLAIDRLRPELDRAEVGNGLVSAVFKIDAGSVASADVLTNRETLRPWLWHFKKPGSPEVHAEQAIAGAIEVSLECVIEPVLMIESDDGSSVRSIPLEGHWKDTQYESGRRRIQLAFSNRPERRKTDKSQVMTHALEFYRTADQVPQDEAERLRPELSPNAQTSDDPFCPPASFGLVGDGP